MDCWHREIQKAATESDVIRNASDFLTLWSPGELAPLTLGWRDVHLENADDIARMKRWLVEDVGGELSVAPGAAQLRELGDYFWHAAARIEEIRRSA